jgi:tripartite-type tricarboxylate transporter receptor subunit TctC
VFAPTNTPRNIISKLNSEIISVLKKQEITKKLNAMGADVATTTPDEFGKIVRDEIKRWAKVIQATGVKSN